MPLARLRRFLLRDIFSLFGVSLLCTSLTDSASARGIAGRADVGRLRSFNIKLLWAQDKVKEGVLVVNKVDGSPSIADLGTKI